MHALHTHTILLTLHNVFVLLSEPYLPFTQGVCLVACLASFTLSSLYIRPLQGDAQKVCDNHWTGMYLIII